jgi:checkpoint serine/threonine-protein kinase
MLYEPGVVTDFELPPGPSIPPPAPVSKAPQSTPPAQPPKPQATAADPNKTIAPRPKALTAPSASSSGASVPSTSTSGKRPEKLRINLDLLYSNSQEYCINEARAHSLGLLGKSNWPAPPPREHSVPLKEDGETTRGDAGASRRLSKGKEKTATRRAGSPTITFNTKAALADIEVFFNSPKKGERGDESSADDDDEDEGRNVVEVPRKLAPEGGRATPTPLGVSTGRAFVPFVDQNAMPPPPPSSNKENEFARAPTTQPAGPSKIPIFQADEESSTTPGPPGRIKPNPFTPLGEKRLPSTLRPLTSTQQPKPQTFVPHVDEVPPTTSRKPAPLQEHPPDNVFGTAKEDAAEVPPTPTPGGSFPARLFTCYSEEGQKPDSRETEQQEGLRSYSPQDPPTRATAAETRSIFTANPPSEASDEAGATAEEEQYYEEDENEVPPEDDGEENVEQVYDDEDEDYRAPLGRFGQFNVMTPITERTFEFTTTRAWTSTSGEGPRFSDYASDNGEDTGRLLTDGIADDVTSGSQFLTSELPPFSEPCNPFEPSTVTSLISLIEPQYNDHRHVDSKHLETLEKFAKKQTRRPSGSMMAVSRADGLPIMLGAEEFTVMEKLGEGGFGAVFLAENSTLAKAKEENLDETFNEDDDGDAFLVALKVVRPRQIWEYAVLGRIHSTLPSPVLPSIISPRGLYVFKDESFLVLDYCRQGTLLDCVNHASQFGVGSALPGGGIDELLAVFFTIELLKLLDALHSAGFIHGDVKIDNCLLRLEEVVEGANAWAVVYDPTGANGWAYKGIRMIDFGRAIDTTFFTPGQQFVGDWPTDERDCVELREGRPWTYQTDYWGLASIIHCMLFGKYIETTAVIDSSSDTPQTRYRITAPLKRYWQTDIWNPLFDLLLNPNVARSDGSLPLTQELEDVRTEMEDWLKVNCDKGGKSLKGFLKKIERATLDRTLAR